MQFPYHEFSYAADSGPARYFRAKRAKTTFRARARENPRARTARPARPGPPCRTAGREGPSMQARNASASKTPVSLVAYLRAELGNSFSYKSAKWARDGARPICVSLRASYDSRELCRSQATISFPPLPKYAGSDTRGT